MKKTILILSIVGLVIGTGFFLHEKGYITLDSKKEEIAKIVKKDSKKEYKVEEAVIKEIDKKRKIIKYGKNEISYRFIRGLKDSDIGKKTIIVFNEKGTPIKIKRIEPSNKTKNNFEYGAENILEIVGKIKNSNNNSINIIGMNKKSVSKDTAIKILKGIIKNKKIYNKDYIYVENINGKKVAFTETKNNKFGIIYYKLKGGGYYIKGIITAPYYTPIDEDILQKYKREIKGKSEKEKEIIFSKYANKYPLIFY